MAVTSVTSLISRVDLADLADLADEAGVPSFPHHSVCVPPEAASLVKEDDSPQ